MKMILRAVCAGVLVSLNACTPLMAVAATQPKKAIRHVVVIFNENISFDHYFGTYPVALNPPGEPAFTALPGTPAIDGLTPDLLTKNPNFLNEANGKGKANPFRLRRDQAATADQSHSYRPEQLAFNRGAMDLFPASVGHADGPRVPGKNEGIPMTSGLTMGYFDGNTVTALWNYAQHFAMSDRSFSSNFGPSTPGAINLISGTTNGAVPQQNALGGLVADGNGGYTMIGDPEPLGDICSNSAGAQVYMKGRNIGDVLTEAKVTWGFFQGGFDLSVVNSNGTTGCKRSNTGITQVPEHDYVPHHQPFMYYPQTANTQHTRPTDAKAVGTNNDGGTKHQYDTHDFLDALKVGNFPSVVYLKAPGYQDGHAGSSDPLDEQRFLVETINAIQQSPEWEHTAIIVAYDDSDGWYDHVKGPTRNGSAGPMDALDGPSKCGDADTALPGIDPATKHAYGRCGFGPRQPLLIISPWAKANFVDHTITDQASILRLIEDLFLDGKRIGQGSFDATAGPLDNMFDFSKNKPQNVHKVLLDPETGTFTPANADSQK